MPAIDSESWNECAAGEMQHMATELLDHGEDLHNAERSKFQTHLNVLRNILRSVWERKTITNHHP